MNTQTKIEELVSIIRQYADKEGIPNIVGNDWDDLNKKYTKEEIKQGFALYVEQFNPLFPFRKISIETVISKFNDLKHKHYSDFIMYDAVSITYE